MAEVSGAQAPPDDEEQVQGAVAAASEREDLPVEAPAQAPVEQDWQKEVHELDAVAHELDALAQTCERVLDETASLTDQEAVQERLSQYSADLVRLPRASQLLNDFRRHLGGIHDRAEHVRSELIRLRGGDTDAITSEEDRLLTSMSGIKDHLLEIIVSLEGVLDTVRGGAPTLLALIGYHQPGFYDYAVQALRVVRIDIVSAVVHQEALRVRAVISDITALAKLEEHAASLQ